MGKVLSTITKPLKNYNIESRAHKIISQKNARPAPKFKADQMSLDKLMKEYPEVYQQSLEKHPHLNQNLKDVFVISDADNPKIPQNPNRPLPLDRHTVNDFEFGVKEPTEVPPGKVTLRGALKFITNHQADPMKVTTSTIATEYLLPENTVKNILKYFRVYEVYVPDNRKTKATFAGPSIPRISVIKDMKKQIDSGQKKE